VADMRKLSLYIDTSVWNMRFDDHAIELQKGTRELIETAERGVYDLYISQAVMAELSRAPDARQSQVSDLIAHLDPTVLPLTGEISDLADSYVLAGVFGSASLADVTHVAFATVHQIDILVSWNYRHLANLNRRAKVIAHNVSQGYYHSLMIVTPFEVISYE